MKDRLGEAKKKDPNFDPKMNFFPIAHRIESLKSQPEKFSFQGQKFSFRSETLEVNEIYKKKSLETE